MVVVVNVRGTRGDHLLSAWFCLSLAVTGTDTLASYVVGAMYRSYYYLSARSYCLLCLIVPVH